MFQPDNVADPDPNKDPDPSDPYVFGPPGSESGFVSQRYGSGSGSFFYHQAKTLIPPVFFNSFELFIFVNDVNVPSKSNKHKNF